MLRSTLGRASVATAAAAAASTTTHPTSHLGLVPRRDVERKPNQEAAEELELKLNDGWLLTDFAPVQADEVDQALGNIISLGDGGNLVMSEAPLSDSDDSVESIGREADVMIQAAGRHGVQSVGDSSNRAVNPFVRDAVFDVLRDPGVQRELYRSLMGSNAFTELVQLRHRGVSALPEPVQGFYADSEVLASHELDDAESVGSRASQPNLFVEALHAIGTGLDKLGQAFHRGLRALFADVATKLKRIAADSSNQREQVAGGIMALAVACFAVILLGRLSRA